MTAPVKTQIRPQADALAELDPRLIKAISHPIRHRLLLALGERVASPKALAAELGLPIGRVSHHVRTLARLGAIELVRTEPRRGAVEHFYRATLRPWLSDDAWATIPLSLRRAVFAEFLQRIARDIAAAGRHGGFDHPRAHVSYTLLELDEPAVAAVADVLAEALARIVEINAECAQRVNTGGGDDPILAELAMVLFERT